MKHSRITTLAAAGVLAVAIPAGMAVSASAATAPTKITHTYSRSVTAKGTVTQRWETKDYWGRDYREYVTTLEHSYTGSHYREYETRNEMAYPHYQETTQKWAWSKAGTFTYTVRHTSA